MVPGVGWKETLGLKPRFGDDVQAGFTGTTDPSTLPIASPWSSSTLQRVVFEDVFGSTLPENTRAAAMRLAPVSRARNLLCASIARFPLVQLDAGIDVPDRESQPTWLYRTNDATSPQQRIVWTVDDLIFYGWSCWWRRNGADGFPLAAGRINQGSWTVNADNQVEIDGIPQDPRDVILIGGWHEGILTFARDDLEDGRTLKQLVRQRLKNPVPATELHQTEGPNLTKDERTELVAEWVAARERGDNTGYTSKHIELKTHGEGIESQLMIEARNALAVDLARHVGVTAGMVDATAPKASLNYETTTGRNQEFSERDLALYMDPITARLSLDDCMPAGKRAAFDLSAFTAPTMPATGPALED
jgi:hypothetical protein